MGVKIHYGDIEPMDDGMRDGVVGATLLGWVGLLATSAYSYLYGYSLIVTIIGVVSGVVAFFGTWMLFGNFCAIFSRVKGSSFAKRKLAERERLEYVPKLVCFIATGILVLGLIGALFLL